MNTSSPLQGACRFRLVDTDWGVFTLVFAGSKLLATFLPQGEAQARRAVARMFPEALEVPGMATKLAQQVQQYFEGRFRAWQVEIEWGRISGFRRTVLEACRLIPFGATASYADLARAAGSPAAARAVGSTMANNPLPLIVPCHRVLRSDGSLGGFSSPLGTSQKTRMLRLENPGFSVLQGNTKKSLRPKRSPMRSSQMLPVSA